MASPRTTLQAFALALTLVPALVDPAAGKQRPLDDRGRPLPALAPLPPVPVPRDNPITPDKIELGRLLFFDPRLSGDGSTSCVSCHQPELGWGDGQDLSRGYPGTQHWRNAQTILDSAYYSKLFWAGESLTLEAQADAAIVGNLAGNGEPETIEERLAQAPDYVARFRRIFGTPSPLYPDVLRAIATFERGAVVQRDTPLDAFLSGRADALTASARHGLLLFEGKARCIQCHNGPLLSDEDFHKLGVPQNPAFTTDPLRQIALRFAFYSRGSTELGDYRTASDDLGLYHTTKAAHDRGRFRTPSLRELVHTAPYMHNGTLFTLEEVVEFYDRGGGDIPERDPLLRPLHLSREEKRDLIAFLKSASGKLIKISPPALPPYQVIK